MQNYDDLLHFLEVGRILVYHLLLLFPFSHFFFSGLPVANYTSEDTKDYIIFLVFLYNLSLKTLARFSCIMIFGCLSETLRFFKHVRRVGCLKAWKLAN